MNRLAHDLPPQLKRPMAVVGAALASVALGGCWGGGDETLNFRAACAPGQTLKELSDRPFADHLWSLKVDCEDASGHTFAPTYIQSEEVKDISPVKPDFGLSVKVNGQGHWWSFINGDPSASYRALPYTTGNYTDITLSGIDRVESAKITEVAP